MKTILFDLYGTLIDIHTEENTDTFWRTLAKKTKRYKAYAPQTLKELYFKECRCLSEKKEEIDITEVFSRIYLSDKADIIRIAKIFRKLSTVYIRLYSGVPYLLKKLKKKGYKLYVLSNAQSSFTLPELIKLKLLSYFDGINLSSDYGIKKPNEAFFKEAIQKNQLKEEIWMIGNDYECDIKPAKALGLHTIFIESNLTPIHDASADLIGFNASRILELLENKTVLT